MTTLVEDTMLRAAAKAIERDGLGVTAEFIEAHGFLVLTLTEPPYSELVLEKRTSK